MSLLATRGTGQMAKAAASTGRRRSGQSDPYKWAAIGAGLMFSLTLPTIGAVLMLAKPKPPVPAWTLEAAALGVDRSQIMLGEAAFHRTCAVCHGPSAEGVPNLGKPLRNSAFVQESTDEQLFELVVKGRPPSDEANTTGALMPPRGAQGLTDESIRSVVCYLRAIQSPDEPVVSVAAWQLKSSDGLGSQASAAAIELNDHPGYDVFIASCSACHGQDAAGLPDLGLPLTTSGFVRSKSDKDLITFIKTGRPSWDGLNTTGVDMPPKGGNPAITDEQLQSIVDYIRALQKQAMGS